MTIDEFSILKVVGNGSYKKVLLVKKMIKKYMNIFSHSIELRYKKLCMILELFFLNN